MLVIFFFSFLLPHCQINVRRWQITGKYASFTFQKWTDLGHVLCNCGQHSPICQEQIEFPVSSIRYATHIYCHLPKLTFIYLFIDLCSLCRSETWCILLQWVLTSADQVITVYVIILLTQQQEIWFFCFVLNYCMLHKLMLIVLRWKTPISEFTLFVGAAQLCIYKPLSLQIYSHK